MRVGVSSVFSADADTIFTKLQAIATLHYICAPLARFTPLDERISWETGATFKLHLKATGIDFGVHTIQVEAYGLDGIYTKESNARVPVWNHIISLEPLPNGQTKYTDIVDVHAGWKTAFIWLWANMFYRHRQRRWKKLLSHAGSVIHFP